MSGVSHVLILPHSIQLYENQLIVRWLVNASLDM